MVEGLRRMEKDSRGFEESNGERGRRRKSGIKKIDMEGKERQEEVAMERGRERK